MIDVIKKAFKIWKQGFALSMSSEMAYKGSFILLLISLIIGDLVGPIIGFIIYTTTSGIPGWSLMEFILFQGLAIFIFGMWHAFIGGLSWETMDLVIEGTFDSVLLKPFYSLVYLASKSVDFHGVVEVFVGIIVIIWALISLKFNLLMLVPFILLIFFALLFILSISIMLGALSVIFINVESLQNLLWVLNLVSAFPLTVYSKGMQFFFTFIIPAAIASYWPASILLEKAALISMIYAVIPVLIFFGISLWLWYFALKKYQSAGG